MSGLSDQFSEPLTNIDKFRQELSQEQLEFLTLSYKPLLDSLLDDIRDRYQRAYKGKKFLCLLNTFLRKEPDDEVLRCWTYLKGYHIVLKRDLVYQGSEFIIAIKLCFEKRACLLRLTHISDDGREVEDTTQLYSCLLRYLTQCEDTLPQYRVYDLRKNSLEEWDPPLETGQFYMFD
jgi:hypothetical protein